MAGQSQLNGFTMQLVGMKNIAKECQKYANHIIGLSASLIIIPLSMCVHPRS